MEQVLVMNVGGLRTLDSQIGVFMGDTFYISEECAEALEEMVKGLLNEDKNTRYFRRYCASYDMVSKTLLPLLLSLDDEVNSDIDDRDQIFCLALKVLAHISQPLECLMPSLRAQLQTLERHRAGTAQVPHKLVELETLVREIQVMLVSMKRAFSKPEPTACILTRLTSMISQETEGKLSEEVCGAIDNMFFLYRNFLYLSDDPNHFNSKLMSLSTVILRLLFQCGIKDLVFYCINSPQYEHWTLSVIEFITLMYKDPERTLCGRYEPCMSASECSDSSGHDEQDSQYCSDPTSSTHSHAHATIMDSSVTGESSAASSSAGSSSASHSKSAAECVTTQVTVIIVREKLKEFSYELLRNGCAKLLYAVKTLLVSERAQAHTSMYYMWNLSFYLMMACRFKLPYACVRELLSVYSVDYLIYTGAQHCELLQLARSRGEKATDIVKQLELVVTGIKYVFRCIDFYWNSSDLTGEERQNLVNMQVMLVQQSDLRLLLLLMLRLYSPDTHHVSFLKCVMKLNHRLLLITELLHSLHPGHVYFDMKQHISNFATHEVMRQYGAILSHHRFCSSQTLEQVFTMMHHVATDCGRQDTLLQLPILNAFCMLDEEPYRHTISKECRELMEYSFSEFLARAQNDPVQCAKQVLSLQQQQHATNSGEMAWEEEGDDEDMAGAAGGEEEWGADELDELYQLCMEHAGSPDMASLVQSDLRARGITRDVTQLDWTALGQTCPEYALPSDIGQVDMATKTLQSLGLDALEMSELSSYHNKAAWYVQKLRAHGQQRHLAWLQGVLLEAAYILLGGYSLRGTHPEEPVLLINTLLRRSLPIVAYTEEQESFLQDKYARGLITELGLEPASCGDTSHGVAQHVWPRVPLTWHVNTLVQKAEALGPVDYSATKFTLHDVKAYCEKMDSVYNTAAHAQSNEPGMAECETSMWMLYIGKANAKA